MACGFPFNDRDRGTLRTGAALCFQRVGMGTGALVLDGDGVGDLLLLLAHVKSP